MRNEIKFRLIVLFPIVFTIYGCKKIDGNQNGFSNQTTVEQFFKSSTNLPYAVEKISLLLKKKESKFHFVEKFVQHQGLPLWQNATINLKPTHSTETSFSQSSNMGNNDTIVKIPIQLQGAQVIHGYLLCTISSDSVSIAVIDGRTYSAYGFMNTSSQDIVAENIVTEIMSFNHAIYNLNNFFLTDTRLFADTSNSIGTRTVKFDTLSSFNGNSNAALCPGGSTIVLVSSIHCLNTYPCTSTWCDECDGCTRWAYQSFCNQEAPSTSPQVVVWTIIQQPEEPGGGGPAPLGWYPTPDPCPPTTGISMTVCDLGWNIVIDPPNVNQSIIDSLADYPCAQAILQQLPSINSMTKSLLQDVFGVNDSVNITFVAKTFTDSLLDGRTIEAQRNANGILNYKIQLNTYMLNIASKDYIIATLLHESIHAYLYYKRVTLDSIAFNQQFPLYDSTPTNMGQHLQMAASYVQVITDVLKSFNPTLNNATNSQYAEALAWGGLDSTPAFQNNTNPNPSFIAFLNDVAKFTNQQHTQNGVLVNCFTFNYKLCQ